MTHSIPDAVALAIDTEIGCVVHSGDFKLDPAPGDGHLSDEARLEALGDAGVSLLMSDSTNVLSAGHSGSEEVVAKALMQQVAEAPERVIIGCFASNVHRLRAIGHAAMAADRKLCLLGLSLRNHSEIARELGMLDWPNDLVLPPAAAAHLPRNRVCTIATGTQGEERGALRRLASGIHGSLSLEAGDRVLLSSRIIPGHERSVYAMIDAMLARGVEVRTRITVPELHVSGHGYRDEQRRLLELLRPRHFIPLHGTRVHLQRHAALASETGVEHTLVLHDGEVACVDADGVRKVGVSSAGVVVVSGRADSPVALSDEVLRQRRQMGRLGVVFVAIAHDRDEPAVAITARGLPLGDALIVEAERAARSALKSKTSQSNRENAREAVRRAVRRRLEEVLGEKPPVEVVSLE